MHTTPPALPIEPPPAFFAWLAQVYRLTPRMLDVLRCRCKHLTHQEAASELGLRRSTFQRYQANTLDQLYLHGGRNALVQWLAREYAAWDKLQR